MSSWAPLVHGRTAYVDFRSNFIVLPEDFEAADIRWAKRHILATTRSADTLPGRPRWCAFRNDSRTVVGVTCMAEEVSDDHHREVELTSKGPRPGRRRLYVFLGLASKNPAARLPPRDLDLFRGLYRYVVDRWEEKSYESRDLHPEAYRYTLETLPKGDVPEIGLNSKDGQVALWPGDMSETLWRAADKSSGSVALDLPSTRVAVSSPFHDVTAGDVSDRRIESRASPRERRPQRLPDPRREGTAGAPIRADERLGDPGKRLPPPTKTVGRWYSAGTLAFCILAGGIFILSRRMQHAVLYWILPPAALAAIGYVLVKLFGALEDRSPQGFLSASELSPEDARSGTPATDVGNPWVEPVRSESPPAGSMRSVPEGYRRPTSSRPGVAENGDAWSWDVDEPAAPAGGSSDHAEDRPSGAYIRDPVARPTLETRTSGPPIPGPSPSPGTEAPRPWPAHRLLRTITTGLTELADQFLGSRTAEPGTPEKPPPDAAPRSMPTGFRRRNGSKAKPADREDAWDWDD